MEIEYREVMYCNYCMVCRYKDLEDTEMPCCECLDEPVNLYTDKPVRFEDEK